MHILLAILPLLILFGPVLLLIKSEKKFDLKHGAISDLNNFKSSKLLYILLLSLWEISEYIFIIFTFKNYLGLPLLILSVSVLIVSLRTLPISSHKYAHIIPQIISCVFAIIVTVIISISTQKYLGFMVSLIMILAVTRIAYSMIKKIKICYWQIEMLIGGLIGLWNIVILL